MCKQGIFKGLDRSKKYFKGMTDIKGIEDTKGTNKY